MPDIHNPRKLFGSTGSSNKMLFLRSPGSTVTMQKEHIGTNTLVRLNTIYKGSIKVANNMYLEWGQDWIYHSEKSSVGVKCRQGIGIQNRSDEDIVGCEERALCRRYMKLWIEG